MVSMKFLYVAIIYAWKNAWPLNFTNLITFTQEYFVSCLAEIGPAVLEKIFKSFFYIQFAAIISP